MENPWTKYTFSRGFWLT